MNFHWLTFVDLGIISVALLAATWIRSRLRLFQSFLIPNSLTAGALLLLFYNYLGPLLGLRGEHLGNLIYHLLSLSFIAMSLRDTPTQRIGRRVVSTGLMMVASFTLQGLLGLGAAFLFIATLYPNLVPAFGLFVPLGFEMGPGQAYSIGIGWEAMGFQGAGSIGLTFAAFGFLWACFGGVLLINHGIRKGWLEPHFQQAFRSAGVRTGVWPRGARLPVGSRLTTETEAIDGMSLNLAVVLLVYALTYLLLQGLTALLSLAGQDGRELAVNLWGISFIFAALTALGVKALCRVLRVDHLLDSGSLTRIAGTSVDVLVAAALGAISLVVVARFWVPLVVMSILAGLLTVFYCLWLTSRLFDEHRFQRAMIIYGAATGTLPTGLALLRILDPEFETPAAVDYMYGSGVAFFLVIPYILAINLPMYGWARRDPRYFLAMFALIAVYLAVFLVIYRVLAGKRAFRRPGQVWLQE
jgi:ESS family glutamate:Na+ symporter